MILVFGGTTEGRKAATELEEAGQLFYYSTKTGEQELTLRHGKRVDGAMDAAAMEAFCRRHDIRLMVDAAHPFAAQLHATVSEVAGRLGIPAIRFERTYVERSEDIVWCEDYDDAIARIDCRTLLATTGVQSIGRLRALEEKGVRVFYRILPRESSLRLARQQGVDERQLCFYHDGADISVDADAILLKESGDSGGFSEKVDAARRRGMTVYAIRRPPTPPGFLCVNGEHGLRRMTERLLPSFFPLKSGLTTGTCATAAAVAQVRRLTSGKELPEVPVLLPNGETISVAVGYGKDYAYAVKEAGDDPDVTDGLEVRAHVEPADSFCVRGGEGVGVFTLPGFDFPPGEPAINRGPREMLRKNMLAMGAPPLCIIISVPDGEQVALKTFNPRLGIEGGISIIGVSGIVKPFSEEAFIASIRKCMEVAKATGTDRVVINSGAKSERYVRDCYPELPRQAFVEYGNYIGATLDMAHDLHFPQVTLGVMLGKAVKLAAGELDTHSRRAVMDKVFVGKMLDEAGCVLDLERLTLARELWTLVPEKKREAFCRVVISHCLACCQPHVPQAELTILLIADDGTIHSLPREHR